MWGHTCNCHLVSSLRVGEPTVIDKEQVKREIKIPLSCWSAEVSQSPGSSLTLTAALTLALTDDPKLVNLASGHSPCDAVIKKNPQPALEPTFQTNTVLH